MREKFHGVPMLPFGILAGFAEEREIRLTDLAEEGFRFRTAERTEEPGKFRLCFYNSLAGGYREMELTDFEMEEEEHTGFFYIYVVYTESETYRKEVRRLIGQYSRYIRLKLMEDDGELAKALTGYPAEKDLVEACSLEEQKRRWFSELPVDGVFPEFPSLALELDRPELYRKYLSMEIGEFSAGYWPSNGLGEHPLARRTPDRLYIGNSFCHLLFPEKSQLFALLEKALREGLSVTLSFSYIRDFLLESTEELLDELSAWCGQKERWLELLVNDWGLAELLRKKRSPYLEPVLGPLLNKRKKDPRLAWKTGSLESLAENSLNADFYREFLVEELGIRRYEWEACGYPVKLPPGNHSLHLPFYQTNTSQFCPLAAGILRKDRGKQKLPENCPHFCETYAYLYPEHLAMAGRYNSLFALDREILKNPEHLEAYRQQGVDRLVINLL